MKNKNNTAITKTEFDRQPQETTRNARHNAYLKSDSLRRIDHKKFLDESLEVGRHVERNAVLALQHTLLKFLTQKISSFTRRAASFK